jgi:hypothetical protein
VGPEKVFGCHSEARFSPKNLSVHCTSIEEKFFASLRMAAKRFFHCSDLRSAEFTRGKLDPT